MKKTILGAALCGVAVAFASPANADTGSDFWTTAVNAIDDWLLDSSGLSSAAASTDAVAAAANSGFLSDSTNALILGATGLPTPSASYITEATQLYLDPLGYDGDAASTLALTTPETYSFIPSVEDGETDLINAITSDFQAGDFGCNASGLCSDPLTIFGYSQSAAIASLVESQLKADNIPTDALRFVLVGANPEGVPDNLYPTEIYNIDGDVFAQPSTIGDTLQQILMGLGLHDAYLGLTSAEIDSATTVVDGMTYINDIPTLTLPELFDAFINVFTGGSAL